MSKKNRKTLVELSEEIVQIVNDETTDYDAKEKVLEHLAESLQLDKNYGITVNTK